MSALREPLGLVNDTRCGSDVGYQTHVRNGTPPCNPCKTAHAAYGMQYMDRNPEARRRNRRLVRARARALTRLAALHPDEYERLRQEELAADPSP